MTTEATPAAAPSTPATDVPATATPEATAPVEANPQSADTPAVDGGGDATAGEPQAAAAPKGPSPADLAKWSQKLSRKEERHKAERAAFEQQKARVAELEALAKVLDTDNEMELLDFYRKSLFDRITTRMVDPEAVPLEDQVAQAIEAARKKEQEKTQATLAASRHEQEKSFAYSAAQYIPGVLAEKFPALAELDPKVVVNAAVNVSLERFRAGQTVDLDKVLQEWNDAEKVRIEKTYSRLRPGDAQIQPNSERAGAVEPAKPEPRKRTAISNAHAATRASPVPDDDALPDDRELNRRAAEALRRSNTGWR